MEVKRAAALSVAVVCLGGPAALSGLLWRSAVVRAEFDWGSGWKSGSFPSDYQDFYLILMIGLVLALSGTLYLILRR